MPDLTEIEDLQAQIASLQKERGRLQAEVSRLLMAEAAHLRALLRRAEPYLVELGPASLWTDVCAALASAPQTEGQP